MLSLEAFDGWVWNKSLGVVAAGHSLVLVLVVLDKAAAVGSPDYKDESESRNRSSCTSEPARRCPPSSQVVADPELQEGSSRSKLL